MNNMKYNGYDISKMYYSGYTVTAAYSCGGYKVFGDDTPTPPTPTPTGMTGLKVSAATTNAGDYSKECESGTLAGGELISHDLPTASTILTIEVGTCVNIIASQSLSNKANVTSIILPSTIEYFRVYSFLTDDASIQSLTIYATTPPTFLNYAEDEWRDIFGYRYPSSKAPEGFKIYVPASSVNAYKTATGWSHMADYIYPIQ